MGNQTLLFVSVGTIRFSNFKLPIANPSNSKNIENIVFSFVLSKCVLELEGLLQLALAHYLQPCLNLS